MISMLSLYLLINHGVSSDKIGKKLTEFLFDMYRGKVFKQMEERQY